ncbi:MAG: bifunctional (p)ppGpp synthetase/guanosine-3',5'-bis(diphosphate) 3'-pyrophosphohydrolase [Spirochaetales bacterium]|nr:bifunctional (p)ppGpp synthetase/guanosine-3',5'-bis(diphosphate) 3'-pyrophosphohydrolase [Spirochaetales bacterium]
MFTQAQDNWLILKGYLALIRTAKKRMSEADLPLIRKAFRFADQAHSKQRRLSGEPYIVHPLAVATILADLGMDSETVAAALLHDVVEDTAHSHDTIQSEFGAGINHLVRGVTKISNMKNQRQLSEKKKSRLKEQEAAENIRLMLLATAKDVRVILIKLADKLHNMRTIDHQKHEKVQRIASEVLEIYAPLAGRLGIFRIKGELEDLAFRALQPEEHTRLVGMLASSRKDQEERIETYRRVIQQRLNEHQIKAQVSGRAKHLYSIYHKMKSSEKDINDIYDLRGIRVIVSQITECYAAMGIVHSLWPPVPGRFKDYIATPKTNGYQSLHTSIIAPDGNPVEVQIRTEEMDRNAEHGIAAHWTYKSNINANEKAARLSWIERLASITESRGREYIEDLREDLSFDEVFVFTPRGDVIALPQGSTVLDFAFRIHTEVGLCCKNAIVNDKNVPLHTVLKSGDRIRIITNRHPAASPNWLRYLHSSGARQKLRSFFRRKEEEEQVEKIVEPEKPSAPLLRIRRKKTSNPKEVPIEVAGSRDIPVHYAGCCTPVPGDRIVGFVTRGRGVTVHRTDCAMLPESAPEKKRLLPANWAGLTEKYPVNIEVKAHDRQGLYLDLVSTITATHTNILKAEADIPRHRGGLMKAEFMVEVEHVDHLSDIMESLRRVPGVESVQRMSK